MYEWIYVETRLAAIQHYIYLVEITVLGNYVHKAP